MEVIANYQNYKIKVEEIKTDFDKGLKLKISIFTENQELKSLFIEEEMRSIITEALVLIDNDTLLVGCANVLYCFGLPTLNLLWKTKTDDICNFKIYPLEGGYLTHGEFYISKIATNGNILWQTAGKDIWVSVDEGKEVITFEKAYILLRDFIGNTYKIDYHSGSLIGKVTQYEKKPWWKFFVAKK